MKAVYFDVDGTLYDKYREYRAGKGTINDAHAFMRYEAFDRLQKGESDEQGLIEDIVQQYYSLLEECTLPERLGQYSSELTEHYHSLVDYHGANGKVFSHALGTSTTFLGELVSHVDFDQVLAPDHELIDTMEYLKERGYQLGIMTSEVYSTVEGVCSALGLDINDFSFSPDPDQYDVHKGFAILCSNNILNKKPSLEGFEKIAQVTGLPAHEISYVGDYLHKDCEPALELGMGAVHVNREAESVRWPTVEGKRYAEVPVIYDIRHVF